MEQELTFQSGALHLVGTLQRPDGQGVSPAVLLIAGSGQVDRNENAHGLPINAFREIADYLAGRGIATFRYDKRGVGASEGNFWGAGFLDNVADASAAMACLRTQEGIRRDQVFLLGHSEGALIATRLAARDAEVAGAIFLAGAARPGEEVLVWQTQQVVQGMRGLNKWLIDHLPIDVPKMQRKQLDKIRRSTKDWYRAQLFTKVNARWMREFLNYDPAQDLPRIQVPVLAITGSKDIQVNPADVDRMAELVPGDFEGHKLPDVTHILRAEEGEPTLSTYKQQARQPMDARVLRLVGEWLQARVSA